MVHPLLRARDWQDRPQLDRLCQWWTSGGPGVCALVGIGGAGKTAIADRFLQNLPGGIPPSPGAAKRDALPRPKGLLVFSFYDAPNPDSFFAEVAAWLGWQPPAGESRAASYQEALRLLAQAGPCLLVLDGLEKVQDDGARGGVFGELLDGRLRDLVLRAADGWLPGVSVLITTRFRLFDLLAQRCTLFWEIGVDQLEPRTALALLRARGVTKATEGQLESLAEEAGHHALTVDLLGGYVAAFCDGDPTGLPPLGDLHVDPEAASIDPRLAAVRLQEQKFGRVAERYRETLAQRDPGALALLERVCLFRLGITAETLAAIFTGEGKQSISGPDLAAMSRQQIEQKLGWLAQMRLLDVTRRDSSLSLGERAGVRASEPSTPLPPHPTSPGGRGVGVRGPEPATPLPPHPTSPRGRGEPPTDPSLLYAIHPAVQDGFLRGLDRDAARQAHEAARKGLEAALGDQPGGRYPSDPATLDVLEEIVHHTLQSGHVKEAWDIHQTRIGGGRNLLWRLGAYERGERICRAFAGGLSPEAFLGRSAGSPTAPPCPFESLSEGDQAGFINEWALYLQHLGRLDAGARCYERANEPDYRCENWKGASISNRNLADVLLLAGRLAAGLQAAEEALRLAEKPDEAADKFKSHAFRAHARALRGETDAALADFRDALHWQHQESGKTDRPLWSDLGYFHTLLLARLGQNAEATGLTEANRRILAEVAGPANYHEPPCNLILADLARERAGWHALKGRGSGAPGTTPFASLRDVPPEQDLAEAVTLQEQAHDWAIARDDKGVLCWSAWVRARIRIEEGSRQMAEGGEEEALEDAGRCIEDGLRLARECGYGIFHVDLLLERARVHLLRGEPGKALEDLRVALEEGHTPAPDSGYPVLLAATDPECGYAWGIAQGRHLRAQALLLKAAQALGRPEFAPATLKSNSLPGEVCTLIDAARKELDQCRRLRKRIKDAKLPETEQVIRDLKKGVLTQYPLKPREHRVAPASRPSFEGSTGDTPVPPDAGTKRHVFLSYCRENQDEVRRLHDDLVAAGETVWWDQGIHGGAEWERAIRRAMDQSYAVVFCLSKELPKRIESGMYPELDHAIALQLRRAPESVFLVPIRLSECPIPDAKVGQTRRLGDFQVIDLFPEPKRAEGFKKLLAALRKCPGRPGNPGE